jgi:adenosylcobinamide-phosphate synthase
LFELALLTALVWDAWRGEPRLKFHPVVWMGTYLGWIGALVAPKEAEPSPNWVAFAAGALAWYGGAMACVLVAWSLQWALAKLHWAAAGLLLGLAF